VAFQDQPPGAGLLMQQAKFPGSHHQWSLCFSGDFIRFAGGCQTGGPLPIEGLWANLVERQGVKKKVHIQKMEN